MFNLAISHIQCQPAIGIAAAGTNVCRHGKLCWLQVASKSHVYLFDITILGPTVFQRGLKTVLEDENVIKVIHDCRGLSDCLYHQYGVALSNVFDTQVADIFLFHMDTGGFLPQRPSTLEECLSKRLNLPHSLLSALTHAQGIVKDNQLLWSLHPMPHSLQKALALETFYVLSLHRTMRSAMMADFNTLVNGYIKVYTQDSDDVLKWTELSTTHLPVDFHTMNSLQAKRKEKALKSFVVDKHGLLVQPENHQDLFGEDRKRTEDSVLELSDPPQCQQIETTPQPTSNKDLDKWDACSEPFNPDPLVRQEIKCQDDPILQNPIASPRLALLNQHFSQLQLASLPEVKPKQIQFRPAAPLMVPRVRMAASQLLAQTRHKYVTQDTP
ncbi:piRNA biogenesis protein EXD1-like [Hyperolius riggenbachi]|uniref:piRNA biogenesis protein EXD1-like n=1 Tax=Hyperolius riggenbachi TaxID=752182 RepID=UPI0035A3517C